MVASPAEERSAMVFQGGDANTQQQQHRDHRGFGGGQRQRREEQGACQQYPPARHQPCALLPHAIDKIQNAGRGAGGGVAAVSAEEALANIWAFGGVDAALHGGGSLPIPALLSRKTQEEVLLEIQRDPRHLHQCPSSESANRPPAFATQQLNQHLLHQQQPQSQFGNGIPSFPMASERYGRTIVVGDGGHHDTRTAIGVYHESDFPQQGRGVDVLVAVDGSGNGGQTGAASPKSSISSDASGGGHSPAAVWEVDMRRGSSKGGGASAGVGRKRTLDPADETLAGLWQPQMIRSSGSPARLRDGEQSIDDLKQLVLCANMELESAPTSTEEDIRKREENVKELLQLVRITSLERDEARDQLQKLLNRMALPSPLEPSSTHLQPDLLLTGLARGNSGFTQFDSLSQTPNYEPYVSSPVASLFEPLPSQEFTNKKSMANSSSTPMAQQQQQQLPLPDYISSTPPAADFDPASAIIDRLVLNKALPEKGKLLQAVMEAGPLLQTLLVAGSLPRWRNPPPLLTFQIPPVSVRARGSGFLNQNAVLNQNYLVQTTPKAFHHQSSLVAPRVYAAASSLASSGSSSLCLRGPVQFTCASSYQGPLGKRQKF